MATPVGHAFAGVLTGLLLTMGRPPLLDYWRDVALFAVLAMAPDLDFVPGILMGEPSAFHQGVTHSVGMTAVVAVAMWLWGNRRGAPWRWALVGAAVYLSHPLVDYLAVDTRLPLGIMLWWPFSDAHVQSGADLFLNVRRESLSMEVIGHDLVALTRELLFLGLPAAAALWVRLRLRRRAPYTEGSSLGTVGGDTGI